MRHVVRPCQENTDSSPQTRLRRWWSSLHQGLTSDRVFLCLMVLAVVSRLLFLTRNDVWTDEYSTLNDCRAPLTKNPLVVMHYLAYQFFRLSLWISPSTFGLRLPSAFFGVLSVAFIYMLTRLWFDRATARIAAALAVISPFLFYFGMEARFYTMMFAWTALSAYFASLFILRGSLIGCFLALLSGLALYMTHPSAVGMVAGEAAAMIIVSFWRWKYWGARVAKLARAHGLGGLLIVLAAGALLGVAIWNIISWAEPPYLAIKSYWHTMPLPRGISYSAGFILSHFGFESSELGWALPISYVFLVVGFVTVCWKKPALTILFLCQYVLSFVALFLSRSDQEYTLKYSVGMFVSQLIWTACGMRVVFAKLAGVLPERHRQRARIAGPIAVLVVSAAIFVPDYLRTAMLSVNPIRKPVSIIASVENTAIHSVFATAAPYCQISNSRDSHIGVPSCDDMEVYLLGSGRPLTPQGQADVLGHILRVGYWTRSAWVLGNGINDEGFPRIHDQVKDHLELIGMYRSSLQKDFYSYLYRLPTAGAFLLYPYSRSFPVSQAQDNAVSISVVCLDEGVWKASLSREETVISGVEVDGGAADAGRIHLTPGAHRLVFRLTSPPPEGPLNVSMENAERESHYSFCYYRKPLQKEPAMLPFPSESLPCVHSLDGSLFEFPLAQVSEKPTTVAMSLRSIQETGRSVFGIIVGDSLRAVVSSPDKPEVSFSTYLPAGTESISVWDMSTSEIIHPTGPTNSRCSAWLSRLTIRPMAAEAPFADSNQLVTRKWQGSSRPVPFFRGDKGKETFAWTAYQDVAVKPVQGSRPGMQAALFSAPGPGVTPFLSPLVPFGSTNAVLLRSAITEQGQRDCRVILRVHYLDANRRVVRVNEMPPPTRLGENPRPGWRDILYFDSARPGEKWYRVEIRIAGLTELPTPDALPDPEHPDQVMLDEFVTEP